MTTKCKFCMIILMVSLFFNMVLLYHVYFRSEGTVACSPEDYGDRYLSDYGPYIEDARRRWTAQNQFDDDPFENRTTSVVTLNDRICVSFEYRSADIGGAPPFYCYSFDDVTLIESREDVE